MVFQLLLSPRTCRLSYRCRRLDDGFIRHCNNLVIQKSHSFLWSSVRCMTSSDGRLRYLEERIQALEKANVDHCSLDRETAHGEIWSLLSECSNKGSYQRSSNGSYRRFSRGSSFSVATVKAKLSERLLRLCCNGVAARRSYLLQWRHSNNPSSNLSTNFSNSDSVNSSNSFSNNSSDSSSFCPVYFWRNAPHPTNEMHDLTMIAWKNVVSSTSRPDRQEAAARRAAAILTFLEKDFDSHSTFVDEFSSSDRQTLPLLAVQPDVRTFGSLLGAWGCCVGSARNVDESSLRLEALAINCMLEVVASMESTSRPSPDRICYNVLLSAMARRVQPSVHEMRLVLQRMMERVKQYLESDEHDTDPDETRERALSFYPDIYSYNYLLDAHANRSALLASESHSSEWTPSQQEALLAEGVLKEMSNLATVPLRPNIYSYNAIIKAWVRSNCDRGRRRAEQILRALASSSSHTAQEQIRGNSAWGTYVPSNTPATNDTDGDANDDANDNTNDDSSKDLNGRVDGHPDDNSDNWPVGLTGRLGYIRSNTQPPPPKFPLPFIPPGVSPNHASFKMVLSALKQAGSSNHSVQDLLRLQFATLGEVQGSNNSNNSNSSNETKTKHPGSKRSTILSFNTMLDSKARQMAHVPEPDALPKLHQLLHQFRSFETPDTSSYNHVIRACYAPWTSQRRRQRSPDATIETNDDHRAAALELVLDTYSSIRRSTIRPDSHTYSHLLKAVACLSDDNDDDANSERVQLCNKIFTDCIHDGQLTKSSFWVIRQMIPITLLTEWIQTHSKNTLHKNKLIQLPGDAVYNFLPKEWKWYGAPHGKIN